MATSTWMNIIQINKKRRLGNQNYEGLNNKKT